MKNAVYFARWEQGNAEDKRKALIIRKKDEKRAHPPSLMNIKKLPAMLFIIQCARIYYIQPYLTPMKAM